MLFNRYVETASALAIQRGAAHRRRRAKTPLFHPCRGAAAWGFHSGSIFVADNSLKAIDAEFGYFGPIGFDVGTALGNLLINYYGLPGLLAPREAVNARELRLKDVREVWNTFAARFLVLAEEKTADVALAYTGYAQAFSAQGVDRCHWLLRH